MRTRRLALSIATAILAVASIDVVALRAQSGGDASQPVESQTPVVGERSESELDAMTARIGATLRCPVCRQQSVAESSARISREMQGIIRSMLVDGKTPEEIEAYFVESYGPWILLRPKAEGANLLVYLAPLGAFLFGGLLFFARLRRTRRDAGHAKATAESADASAEDHVGKTDRDWLDAALRGS